MKGTNYVSSIYYQHPDTWFGDCMPLYAEGAFQLYHQRDTRKPGPFGEPFGWALARTTDFVNYEDLGESLEKGADEAQDQFIFAGSVFEAKGTYYALYTGYNRDYPDQGKASQVLMIATSTDLVNWTKTDRSLVVPQPGYDKDDWRDPFILWDDEREVFLMILGARLEGDKKLLTGRTVAFTSTDLENWEFEGDFWAPDLYTMHEMPDLFKMGEWWYLLTTEYSDKSKTVYRMSRSLSGPWSAPVDDAFDGRSYYAARSASDGEHRYLFGWVATKEGEKDSAPWQWGGTLVVHEVYQRPDGSLGVRIPDTVTSAFSDHKQLLEQPETIRNADGRAQLTLAEQAGDTFLWETTLSVAEGTRSFALLLARDEASGDAYEFLFEVGENRLRFDKVPNYPWNRYDNKGLERPFTVTSNHKIHIQVVVDGSIATVYANGVALNARIYDVKGQTLALQAIDGEVTVHESVLRHLGQERAEATLAAAAATA